MPARRKTSVPAGAAPGAAAELALPPDGRRRVVVSRVTPSVDGGRTPIKRIAGDTLVIEADLVVDGHDTLAGVVCATHVGSGEVREAPIGELREGDRYRGALVLDRLGDWTFEVAGWIDVFASLRLGLAKKWEARQDVALELTMAAQLIVAAAARAADSGAADDAALLRQHAERLGAAPARGETPGVKVEAALAAPLAAAMARHPDRSLESRSGPYPVIVDRERAAFSAWYELFPRSCGAPGQHGTLRDAAARLPYVAGLGFDVVYLPPVHPIGRTHRKGPNNSLESSVDDVGSPWAIGAAEGGHTAVHPQLGTLDDFEHLRATAEQLGLELALDVAFQASPDHPWVAEHPQWFRHRPDGSIQFAENPPKKYQDIYPIDFETSDWPDLWRALRDVFLFWIERGVRAFRVDNPHTKAVPFWQWCLSDLRRRHPDVIFLAEAFTRPKLMAALAKAGFSQSYTYFTWRNTRAELTSYMQELTRGEWAEVFRPNFWPNTPDILPEQLQFGGRPAFTARLVLAATLSSNWGIYGPVFELMCAEARPDSGEYQDSEKFQLVAWDLDSEASLAPLIRRVNGIRRDHAALQRNDSLQIHPTDNEQLLCYSKRAGDDVLLMVVNLDPHHRQAGWTQLDLAALGLRADRSFQVHDLMSAGRWIWAGGRNYVELDPRGDNAHIFRVLAHVQRESDFDYFD